MKKQNRAKFVKEAREKMNDAKEKLDLLLEIRRLYADIELYEGVLEDIGNDFPNVDEPHLYHRLAMSWTARLALKQVRNSK